MELLAYFGDLNPCCQCSCWFSTVVSLMGLILVVWLLIFPWIPEPVIQYSVRNHPTHQYSLKQCMCSVPHRHVTRTYCWWVRTITSEHDIIDLPYCPRRLLALAHSFSLVYPDRRYWSGLRGEFSEMKLSEWTLANCRSQADIFIYHWHPGCQSERPNALTVQRGAHPIRWLFERVTGEIVSLSCTPKLHYYTVSLFLHHIGFVKPGRWKQQRKYQNLVLILFQVSPTLRHKWYFALF